MALKFRKNIKYGCDSISYFVNKQIDTLTSINHHFRQYNLLIHAEKVLRVLAAVFFTFTQGAKEQADAPWMLHSLHNTNMAYAMPMETPAHALTR
jgi:hypothetical protein